MLARSRVAALILACLANCPLHAATLVDLQLVPDGSADPPGDRIDVSVMRLPGEKNVACQVRAYVVSPDRKGTERVPTNRATHSDAGGLFELRQSLETDPHKQTSAQIPIPYADLSLQPGTHDLAYEVTILTDGRPDVTAATQLSRVRITRDTRKKMTTRRIVVDEVVQQRSQPVVVSNAPRAGHPRPRVDRRNARLKVTVPVHRETTTTTDVNIPGGFERQLIPPDKIDAAASSYAARDSLNNAGAWQPLSEVLSAEARTVFFATNRAAQHAGQGGKTRFTAAVSPDLTWGKCVVNIPAEHIRGQLEQASWWLPRDPSKIFAVERMQIMPAADLFREASQRDILVYVHGFNTDFDFAVLRTAQLHYDLRFPGAALAMSWPSANDVTDYQGDRQRASQSADALATTLGTIISQLNASSPRDQPRKLHILAHSLGNKVLLNAIYKLHEQNRLLAGRHTFGQIVLAAPDVGALEFNNLIPYLLDSAERVTYYYCTRDAALTASRNINKYEPVGMMAFFDDQLDTVNADDVGTSFLFHGYYASSRQVLLDLQLLFNLGRSPSERTPPLVGSGLVLGHRHWSFATMEISVASANE